MGSLTGVIYPSYAVTHEGCDLYVKHEICVRATFPQPLLRPVCPPHFPWGDISTWDKRGHFYFALTGRICGCSRLAMVRAS